MRVGDRFGNLIWTYLCRLSTLFLVAEPKKSQIVKKLVGVVFGGCGQLILGLGVAVHGLIGLGLWLGVPKPHFAHP